MNFPSRLVEEAVNEISRLPGIGKKTALRLALFLLKEEKESVESLSEALVKLRNETTYCKSCHNISDHEICSICSSHNRDRSTLCVVEQTTDLLALENTNQYNGLYHVLGGIISPLEGIGPEDINLSSLFRRFPSEEINEVILALSPTMEGDTTAFYISKKIKEHGVKITTIARGIAIGGELEYTDEITLGRSLLTRTAFDAS